MANKKWESYEAKEQIYVSVIEAMISSGLSKQKEVGVYKYPEPIQFHAGGFTFTMKIEVKFNIVPVFYYEIMCRSEFGGTCWQKSRTYKTPQEACSALIEGNRQLGTSLIENMFQV